MGERLRGAVVPQGGIQRPSIWIHAASLGEVKISAPVCRELLTKFPDYGTVFSTSTPVGKKQARSLLEGVKAIFLLPLDLPWTICPVVKRFQPRFFLVAETEFWPNLFFCMKKKGVHVALFNGRISDRSFKRYKLFRVLFRRVLSCVELFCMQTVRDAERIQALGVPRERVHVTGNVKFDAPYTPLKSHEAEELRQVLKIGIGEPLWVAGSVHPEEFPVLFGAYQKLRKVRSEVKWIVIPRHLYDVTRFKGVLDAGGASWALWDGKSPVSTSWDILLVNALGQLVRLYQLGFAAFVGGSLAPIGGHNPLEPLRYGVPTFFGPRMENFREIRDIILHEAVGEEVSSGDELSNSLVQLLKDLRRREEIQSRCMRLFEEHQGAARHFIQKLEEWIRESA